MFLSEVTYFRWAHCTQRHQTREQEVPGIPCLTTWLAPLPETGSTWVSHVVCTGGTTQTKQHFPQLLKKHYAHIITRVDPCGPDRRKWLFSEVRGGIWTPHSPVLIKISADKRPLNQLTVKNLFFSLIIKTFCH